MRRDGMTTFALSLGSGSRSQSRRRLRQSRNIQCDSRSSTVTADVRECGASPTEYSLRFKSTGLWSSRASTAGATQDVGKRGKWGSCRTFSCADPTLEHNFAAEKLGSVPSVPGFPIPMNAPSVPRFRVKSIAQAASPPTLAKNPRMGHPQWEWRMQRSLKVGRRQMLKPVGISTGSVLVAAINGPRESQRTSDVIRHSGYSIRCGRGSYQGFVPSAHQKDTAN